MPRLAPVTRTRRAEPSRPPLAPIEPAGLQLLEAPYDVDVQPPLHQGRAPRCLADLAVEGDEAALPAVVARLDPELAVAREALRREAQPARPEQHAGPRRLAARAREEAGVRCDALRHVLEPDPDRDAAVRGREHRALRGFDAADRAPGPVLEDAREQAHRSRVGDEALDRRERAPAHAPSSSQKSKKLNHW